MRKGRGNMSHALVVLPLTMAVLLVSLCVPVACIASTGPVAPIPDPADCGHRSVSLASMPMHGTLPETQSTPVHQHGDPVECKHSNGNVQAVSIDQQVRPADVTAVPAVTALVVPAPVSLATVVNDRPARPPGLVLTVSQLRV